MRPHARPLATASRTVLILLLALGIPASVFALGGPVVIGGDDADDHGEHVDDACRGCGPLNAAKGLCTNACTATPCDDPARDIDAGGPGTGACRQFDGDAASCARAWHTTAEGDAASCFVLDGNLEGWLYIEDGFNNIAPNVLNGNLLAVCIGCSDDPSPGGDSASGAFEFGFDDSNLPGLGWTRTRLSTVSEIEGFFDGTGATTIGDAGIIYMPSDENEVEGGLTPEEIAVVNADAQAIADFVAAGGGLFTHTQAQILGGYGWLRTLLPDLLFAEESACEEELLQLTPEGQQSFPQLDDRVVSAATPWHTVFSGNIGDLDVLVVGPCRRGSLQACADPERTTLLTGADACRQLDGDETACEAAWRFNSEALPAPCFLCESDAGSCGAAGECRDCEIEDAALGLCENTCFDLDSLCPDTGRSVVPACEDLDAQACASGWEFQDTGPAGCFVCPEVGGECETVGVCEECDEAAFSLGLCTNACVDFDTFCADTSRMPLDDCSDLSFDQQACGTGWEFANGFGVSCNLCSFVGESCDFVGECIECDADNQTEGLCDNACGLFPPGGSEQAVVIGGAQVIIDPSPQATPTATPTIVATATDTPVPTATPTPTPSVTPSPSPTASATLGPPTASPAPTETPTPTVTPSATPTVVTTPVAGFLPHFQCYEVARRPFPAPGTLGLADVFSTGTVRPRAAKRLCAPADKNGEDPGAPADARHLVGYSLGRQDPRLERVRAGSILVTNQLGILTPELVRPDLLLVPTAKDLAATPPALPAGAIDHFKCYRIQRARTRVAGVTVRDQFGEIRVDVKRPRRLCVASDKNGEGIQDAAAALVCYDVRQNPRRPRFRGPDPIFVANQLQTGAIAITRPTELCVPSVVAIL